VATSTMHAPSVPATPIAAMSCSALSHLRTAAS
jgi:hypothetical protein